MDYFDDSTDYSAWGATDFGSDYVPDASWETYQPTDLMAQFTPDILSSREMYDASLAGVNANPSAAFNPSVYGMAAGTPDYVLNRAGVPVGIDPATGQPTGALYSQGALGAPAPNNTGLLGAPGGFLNALTSPASLLGMGGGLASIIGALASGGVTGGSQFKPSVAQQANMGIGNQWAQMGAQGQLPLQQQQASLLASIMSGQGLAQPYAAAIEKAYEPQLGSLYQQAVDAGRSRGFYDSPATAPPGGAILGPGLSDLQGQIARDKLNLMMQLPAAYNTPIQNQGTFAQNYLGAAQHAPINSQQTQPIGTQIGTALGSGLQGVGQGIAQQQTADQQRQFQNSMLMAMANNRGGDTSMSFSWPQYGGL